MSEFYDPSVVGHKKVPLAPRPANLAGKVVQLPKREDVPHPINEQLIVELCSR